METSNIRYEERNIFIYTLFSGIGSLLAALYLEATFEGDPFLIGLSHLVRDIGIALLVGAYLSVTVERLNTLKTQREVERYIRIVGDNFLLAVYGKKHPLELFDIIKVSIVDQPFIRNFFNVEVHVHDFTDNYIEAAPHNG